MSDCLLLNGIRDQGYNIAEKILLPITHALSSVTKIVRSIKTVYDPLINFVYLLLLHIPHRLCVKTVHIYYVYPLMLSLGVILILILDYSQKNMLLKPGCFS